MKNQFRDMHSHMQENMNQTSYADKSKDLKTEDLKNSSTKGKGSDYIDFEEVK